MMASTGWTTLIDAPGLAAALGRDDLIVLDCRFQLGAPDAGEAAWRQSRIPGARYAHLGRDLADQRLQGEGRNPWPAAETFAAVLARLGITPAHQVVVYDDGDASFAGRAWWMLRLIGYSRAAVLDGGFAGWQARGLPVEHTSPAAPTPVAVETDARFDLARLIGADEVLLHVEAGGLLVDARAPDRFTGEFEPMEPKAGHIPGALNRPFGLNLENGHFRPREALRHDFEALLDGRPAQELVVMCGSGVSACHHLLAMAHAGLEGARLYPGSWSGWVSDPSRPVATGA